MRRFPFITKYIFYTISQDLLTKILKLIIASYSCSFSWLEIIVIERRFIIDKINEITIRDLKDPRHKFRLAEDEKFSRIRLSSVSRFLIRQFKIQMNAKWIYLNSDRKWLNYEEMRKVFRYHYQM